MLDQQRHLSCMEERTGMNATDICGLVGRVLLDEDYVEMRAWTFTVCRYNLLDGGTEYRVRAEGKR